jgi:hypothetical protein
MATREDNKLAVDKRGVDDPDASAPSSLPPNRNRHQPLTVAAHSSSPPQRLGR